MENWDKWERAAESQMIISKVKINVAAKFIWQTEMQTIGEKENS
jgi:hypothetical protein